MSLAVDRYSLLQSTLQDVMDKKSDLIKLMSEYDQKVNKVYHEIETGRFNAAQGYKKVKELQDVLRKRRVIKHELSHIQTLIDTIKPDKIFETLNKAEKRIQGSLTGNVEYRDGWNVRIEELLGE